VTLRKFNSSVDLVVLTFNEELNLSHCLQSVKGLVNNIFVVDSGSSDRTVQVARENGAEVIFHPFINQAEQFNWALDNLPFTAGWILKLDADEYLLPELSAEIGRWLEDGTMTASGVYMKRRMVFMNRWIRHGGYYPTWLLRLFRRGCARSEMTEMDEHLVLTSGHSTKLSNDFVDHNRKGLSEWSLKHEAYASRQARVLLERAGTTDVDGVKPRLLGNQVERKRWLKHNVYGKFPLFVRPCLYFLYRYFLRLGLLDGKQGLIFHSLHAGWYMFYIDARIFEMKRILDSKTPTKPPK